MTTFWAWAVVILATYLYNADCIIVAVFYFFYYLPSSRIFFLCQDQLSGGVPPHLAQPCCEALGRALIRVIIVTYKNTPNRVERDTHSPEQGFKLVHVKECYKRFSISLQKRNIAAVRLLPSPQFFSSAALVIFPPLSDANLSSSLYKCNIPWISFPCIDKRTAQVIVLTLYI